MWEYLVLSVDSEISGDELEAWLNDIGVEGWELTGAVSANGDAIFKRLLRGSSVTMKRQQEKSDMARVFAAKSGRRGVIAVSLGKES